MVAVCFVCLGNICRSPMAEAILKKIAVVRGIDSSLKITSAATSDCEEGNPVYPPIAALLREKGYNFSHRSRQITKRDIINNDFILVMDSSNLFDVLRIAGGEYGDKIYKLGKFAGRETDIADPWYTRNFARTYDEIYKCCNNFADFLQSTRAGMLDYDRRH